MRKLLNKTEINTKAHHIKETSNSRAPNNDQESDEEKFYSISNNEPSIDHLDAEIKLEQNPSQAHESQPNAGSGLGPNLAASNDHSEQQLSSYVDQ